MPDASFVPALRPAPLPSEARATLSTLRDLVRWGASRLSAAGVACGHGVDDPRDEAAWMLAWTLHLAPTAIDAYLDAHATPAERDAFIALIERRVSERVPAAYLMGEAWLQGVRFLSDPRALVPRSLIADLLVGESHDALDVWLARGAAPTRVLDLCTGGGSLAVLAALRYPDAQVVGSDLCADALALASQNVALHGVSSRVRLVQSDVFDALGEARFDLIVSNPPYVNDASMAALPAEFRAEPRSALAGGADGMTLVRRIIDGAARHLVPGGLLVIEIGHEARHFEHAFTDLEHAWLAVPAGDRMVALVVREQLPDA